MPRLLLRDGGVVADDWRYLDDAGAPAAFEADGTHPSALILRFAEWSADKPRWLAFGGRLGVILTPAQAVDVLLPDLPRLSLIGTDFPGPAEGRGYTQGRLLRERHGFRGELRAVGHVRRDQLFFLARCGFNSFELPEALIEDAVAALHTFTAEYQPTNDAGLMQRLARR